MELLPPRTMVVELPLQMEVVKPLFLMEELELLSLQMEVVEQVELLHFLLVEVVLLPRKEELLF